MVILQFVFVVKIIICSGKVNIPIFYCQKKPIISHTHSGLWYNLCILFFSKELIILAKRGWTDEETNYLIESYNNLDLTIEDIANTLGRKKDTIVKKARALGIKKLRFKDVPVPQGHRLCRACREIKPYSEFHKNISKKNDPYALFLTGLIANETGYGSSRRYKEDNNVGGYEVYSPTSKGRSFSSKEESVYAVARLLSEEYLSEDGLYFNGKSSYAINKLYCQSTSSGDMFDWHRTIDKIANDFKSMINSNYKYKNEGL